MCYVSLNSGDVFRYRCLKVSPRLPQTFMIFPLHRWIVMADNTQHVFSNVFIYRRLNKTEDYCFVRMISEKKNSFTHWELRIFINQVMWDRCQSILTYHIWLRCAFGRKMSKRLFICLSSFSTWLRSFSWISLPYIGNEINTKSKASEWNKEADQYKTNSVDDTSRLFWLSLFEVVSYFPDVCIHKNRC